MKHWQVTVKEVGMPRPVVSSFLGNKSREEIIQFYGLKNSDVEWYKVELLTD